MNDDNYARDIVIVALIGLVGIIAMAVIGQQCGTKEGFASGYIQLKQALAVPKKFVEQSKRTTAVAVYNEWCKENEK